RPLLEREERARGGRNRAVARAPRLLLHSPLEHRSRSLLDSPLELLGWNFEPDDQRRMAGLAAPEPVFAPREERPHLGQFERTDDASPVVWMHCCGGRRVALGEQLV